MFYDAMIAKLITYGKTRKSALETMQSALGEYVIRGISHNISFLEAVMGHAHFASGDITTNFIEDEYPDGFFGAELTSETTKILLAVAAHITIEDSKRAAEISGQLKGRKKPIGNRWVISIDGDKYPIYVKPKDNGYELRHDSEEFNVKSSWILGNRLFHGTVDGKPVFVQVEAFAGGLQLTHAGSKVKVTMRSPRIAELDKFMPEPKVSKDSSQIEAPI